MRSFWMTAAKLPQDLLELEEEDLQGLGLMAVPARRLKRLLAHIKVRSSYNFVCAARISAAKLGCIERDTARSLGGFIPKCPVVSSVTVGRMLLSFERIFM